jgi:hypothetical protein
VYEYATTETLSAPDNAYGFTGDYGIDQHMLGITFGYSFGE